MCVCIQVSMNTSQRLKDNLHELVFLPPHRLWGLNSGWQAWQQVSSLLSHLDRPKRLLIATVQTSLYLRNHVLLPPQVTLLIPPTVCVCVIFFVLAGLPQLSYVEALSFKHQKSLCHVMFRVLYRGIAVVHFLN